MKHAGGSWPTFLCCGSNDSIICTALSTLLLSGLCEVIGAGPCWCCLRWWKDFSGLGHCVFLVGERSFRPMDTKRVSCPGTCCGRTPYLCSSGPQCLWARNGISGSYSKRIPQLVLFFLLSFSSCFHPPTLMSLGSGGNSQVQLGSPLPSAAPDQSPLLVMFGTPDVVIETPI